MTKPQPYLPAVIDWLTRGLAKAAQLADQRETDPARRCRARKELIDALGQNMVRKFGAHIGQQGSIVRVQCCSVIASSTMGLPGALTNWKTAAEKKSATTATAAQMGATVQ